MKVSPFNTFFFLSILIIRFGPAQPHDHDQFVSQRWGMEHGLPQSSVNDIIQTRDGYLWLATFQGLVRFNGYSFKVFDLSNSNGLKSDRMITLFEDRSGSIWCGTEEGLVKFSSGRFRMYRYKHHARNFAPLMVNEDSRGVLWIVVESKSYRLVDTSFVFAPIVSNPEAVKRALADNSAIWLAHGSVLLRTTGDSVVLIKDFSSSLKDDIQHIIEDPNDHNIVWIATSGSGLISYSISTQSVRTYSVKDGLPSNYFRRLYVDLKNQLWTLGFNGISRYDGKKFIPLTTVDGPYDNEFNTFLHDVEGNYWSGTPSQGLFRLRSSIISMINQNSGLKEGKMLSLFRQKDGSFLFGTNCGGMYEWRNGKAIYSSINKYLINLCIWSVFEDSKGRVWIGSRELMRFDDVSKQGIVYDSANGFDGVDVFAIMEDSKGTVWIGCQNGLFRFSGNTFTSFTTFDGLPSNDVRTLYEDRSGRIWIGTLNGVARYENGILITVPLNNGKLELLRSKYVRAITEDENGTIWFGTYGGGIIRLSGGSFSLITTKDGLFDNIISHLIDDGNGYFWIGCNRGIFRVSKAELNNVADGKALQVRSTVFGTDDGMVSAETNGGFQPSAVIDTDGNIFFPTVNGVAIVATRNVTLNTIPPNSYIESIKIESQEYPPDSAMTVPYDSTTIEIGYAALSYINQNKIRYKYMLEGVDEHWVDAGSRRTAYYNNVPPGTHTFRIIASNNDGVWNTTGATLQLTVLPPFWMTWWFRAMIIIFFLSTGPAIYYFRVTQLKNEQENQKKFAAMLINSQEQERRRIASELHDGLGQQILIMKNRAEMALNQIKDPEKVKEQLNEISRSAIISMNDVRSISHGLRPIHLEQFGLHDTIESLCEQVKASSTIEWSYYIDKVNGMIPPEMEINFYRILQEGINNILRHSSATEATVLIRNTGTTIVAILWDNGKGFDPEVISTGLGLNGIRERVDTLDGMYEIQSMPGEGTTMTVQIPLRKPGKS